MKFRVREGKTWREKRAGEVVDIEPHRAQLVPWCLEAMPAEIDAPIGDASGQAGKDPEAKPKGKKK